MQDKFKDKMMIHSGADSVRIIFVQELSQLKKDSSSMKVWSGCKPVPVRRQ
jgi:hypothetical protein